MTNRERVLAGYGNRCRWCGSPGPLEFDHVHEDGATHRAQLREKIEAWLVREHRETGHWSPRIILLCLDCHNRKSGRVSMPPRQGATGLNIALPDDLAMQLSALAAQARYGSKSRVLEAAMQALLESNASVSLVDTYHKRLDVLESNITTALHALTTSLETLTREHTAIREKLTALETLMKTNMSDREHQQSSLQHNLIGAFDRLAKQLVTAIQERKSGWFSKT